MPGANCAIFGCSTSRKSTGVSIFRVPRSEDEYSRNWRDKLIQIITRDRQVDKGLQRQIEQKNLFICERHFKQEQILKRKLIINLCIVTKKDYDLCNYLDCKGYKLA